MDKNSIKKYAVWARRELISRVSQKALQYGISEKEIVDAAADTINGQLLSANEKKQRQNLINRIKEGGRDGYQLAMEEAAYTWFNRFSALRFMEVNGYLPTHIRVFTDEQNAFKPQILAETIHLELDGLNMEKVYELKDQNKTDELYKYLLITQCNALSAILPGMFTRLADYTELLFPDNLLREGSVIEQMISMIPEDDWKDAVQIIGWLYQYYNAEPKDKVFENLKKNIKISKENIPAATQQFTPDWIVRYMVENSLGRLWVEGHPNDELKSNWKYYLEGAEQAPEVQAQLAEICKQYAALKPEEIKVIDPCMGSGHILVYMFDVLVQIYEAYGYNAREAAGLILQNNLYGLDIDDRAAQLAYFAVMMKARQYDRRIFSRGIQPHVYAIVESNRIPRDILDYYENGNVDLKKAMETIVDELHDAKEYGSILKVTHVDFAALYARLDEVKEDISLFATAAQSELRPLIEVAEVLAQKYHIVVTNPPYMGAAGMGDKLSKYVKSNYPDTKSDMSTVCMERCLFACNDIGFVSMINIPVWMFLTTYEQLRHKLLRNNTYVSLVHPGRGIFGSDFGTTTFVIAKRYISGYIGSYRRLFDQQGEVQSVEERERAFLTKKGEFNTCQDNYTKIPGEPVAYWVSERIIDIYRRAKKIEDVATPKQGFATTDNNTFLRFWYEIDFGKFSTGLRSHTDIVPNTKWVPYNKGGAYRPWYGNLDYVCQWDNAGAALKSHPKAVLRNLDYQFRKSITWSLTNSSFFGARYREAGSLFDTNGMSLFADEGLYYYLLAFLCCKPATEFMKITNPTLASQVGDIARLPIIISNNQEQREKTTLITKDTVALSKADWDSFETSWDFQRHPLTISAIQLHHSRLSDCWQDWVLACNERFVNLKNNEEELNRIFIDIYGLQDELKPDVEDKDVTVRKADLQRDIRSLLSYAVGCMFGRYSLDCEGLTYAGGNWDSTKYITYPADKDNIIPICDDDYFNDDITGRFITWVETVYGKDTLEENLKFISDALGGKGTPRDVIRSYFINDFYADHLKIYQKRPIYWLFDSGKNNGFKALVYMHRYQPDTIARMRTDYVHEQQSRYRTTIADLEQRVNSASTGERVKLSKQLQKLQDQATEIRSFEEKIHHLADMMIPIDLDDGVKVNYAKFGDVLAKIK